MARNSTRRRFLKLSTLSLGALAVPEKKQINWLDLPDSKAGKKIVCIGGHPGDPEFGCGGTMAKYSSEGHDIVFLYLTRGEAYDNSISHAKAAELRTREAEVACKALNVTPKYAGQIDGATVLNAAQTAMMLKMLTEEKPDLVFTQWPMDTHPDHQVAGLLALNAWTKMDRAFDLYFYEVNTGSETMSFVPTDYVDITAYKDKKKAAMWAHKTQDPEKTYNDFFRQMEEFRGLEAGVAAAEAFVHYKMKAARTGIQ